MFGNIEFRHHFDSRDDCRVQILSRFHHFAERTVDAKTDRRALGPGLDMNVAGTLRHSLDDCIVDEVDDWAALGQQLSSSQIEVDRLGFQFQLLDIQVGCDRINGKVLFVASRQQPIDTAGEREHGADATTAQSRKRVDRRQVVGVGHRDGQFATDPHQGQRTKRSACSRGISRTATGSIRPSRSRTPSTPSCSPSSGSRSPSSTSPSSVTISPNRLVRNCFRREPSAAFCSASVLLGLGCLMRQCRVELILANETRFDQPLSQRYLRFGVGTQRWRNHRLGCQIRVEIDSR